MNRPEEVIQEFVDRIKKLDPDNATVKQWEDAANSFDEAAAAYEM